MANVRMFVLMGQSNNQGTPGTAAQVGAAYALAPVATHPTRALEWETSGGLQELKDNRTGTVLSVYQALPGSAWMACANVLTTALPDTFVFVRTARGGSSLLAANSNPSTGDWSESGDRFGTMTSRFTSAKAAVLAAGHTIISVDGIWHGGERDALIGGDLGSFQAAFQNLLPRFRTAIGYPAAKLYVVRVGNPSYNVPHTPASAYSSAVLANVALVRGYQDAGCTAITDLDMAYTGTVNFPALGYMRSDSAHHTQPGYNVMGNETGAFIADALGGDPEEPPPDPRSAIIGGIASFLMQAPAVPRPPATGPAHFESIGTLKAHSTATGVDAPAGVEVDDAILLVAMSNSAVTYTWPTGFTQCVFKQQSASTIAAAIKIATADGTNDDTDTYVVVPTSGSFTAQAIRISGVDTASPVRAVSVAGGAGEQNTSLTGVPTGDLLVHAAGINNGAYAPPSPAGYTDRNGGAVRIDIATKDQSATGDTGNVNGGALSGSLPVPSFLLAIKGGA